MGTSYIIIVPRICKVTLDGVCYASAMKQLRIGMFVGRLVCWLVCPFQHKIQNKLIVIPKHSKDKIREIKGQALHMMS